MNRRSFILGSATLTLSQLMVSCGGSKNETLKVRLLKDSIPAQLLDDFRKTFKQKVWLEFTPEAQLKDFYANLEKWHQPLKNENPFKIPFLNSETKAIPDLVTLGDYWLAPAIRQGLIQPIDLSKLAGWEKLPQRWQELVKRDRQGKLDTNGKIWGAPYRWGSTAIAYRRDKFKSLGWTPKDWDDLWHKDLRDRISLLNQPREIIGLTLKKLGYSYNAKNLDTISNLKNSLEQLNSQAKFYSSDTYLQPLILGDTWLAVGWSTDILLAKRREPEIEVVFPQSGTALWADVWVRPSSGVANNTKTSPIVATPNLVEKWIDFCWQSQIASQISLFTRAASPIIFGMNPNEFPSSLRENNLFFPDASVLEKSDFLYPLPPSTIDQYRSLWQQIRAY